MSNSPKMNYEKMVTESLHIFDSDSDGEHNKKSKPVFAGLSHDGSALLVGEEDQPQSKSNQIDKPHSKDSYILGVLCMMGNLASFSILHVAIKYALYRRNQKLNPFDTTVGMALVLAPINGLI